MSGPNRILPAEFLFTCDRDGAVKLRLEESQEKDDEAASLQPVSIPSFVRRQCLEGGSRQALAVKRDGKWKTWSYSEYIHDVHLAAKAFIHLGLDPLSSVAILGFNSPEWFFSSLGAICAGGISVGLYPTNSADANRFVMADSRANVLVCEDAAAVEAVWDVTKDVPSIKAIVQYTGTPVRPGVLSWQQLMDLGAEVPTEALEERLQGIAINQCAVLIYTSGTTGNPKGVMLSHDNLVFTTVNAVKTLKLRDREEVSVSFLPLSHIAALLADVYAILACVGSVYFADRMALKGSLLDSLREVRPTMFLAMPRVWEKIMEGMVDKGKALNGLKKKVSAACKQAGLQHHLIGKNGVVFKMAEKVFYCKVKEALGLDRCKLFLTGAAPISQETVKYFLSLDVVIQELYGMSESSGPHTMSIMDGGGGGEGSLGGMGGMRLGSVGRTLPGLKSKLINVTGESGEGELCMWGRNVMMGYLGREDKTREDTDEEGWLHSGDLATVDKDGFVFITGRIKELLITSGGENISPVPIEEALKQELNPIVSNAILIGDRKKFLSVFLTFRTEVDPTTDLPTGRLTPAAAGWCAGMGRIGSGVGQAAETTVEEVLKGPDPGVMAAIQAGIDRVNEKAVSNAARVQKWTVLPRDVSVAGGELGPTMKLKRFAFNNKYAEAIDRFYL